MTWMPVCQVEVAVGTTREGLTRPQEDAAQLQPGGAGQETMEGRMVSKARLEAD